jgi:predicted ATP-dependent serine protease
MKQDSLNGFVALNKYEVIAVNGGRGQYDNSSYKPPSEYEKFLEAKAEADRKKEQKQQIANTVSNVVSTGIVAAVSVLLSGAAGIVFSLLTSNPDRVN